MHAAMLAQVCHLHVALQKEESSQRVSFVVGDVEEAMTEVMDDDQFEQLHAAQLESAHSGR